jgi:hypothetical protein
MDGGIHAFACQVDDGRRGGNLHVDPRMRRVEARQARDEPPQRPGRVGTDAQGGWLGLQVVYRGLDLREADLQFFREACPRPGQADGIHATPDQ